MLWVQAIALILSVVIGMMTFTGSCVATLKLHGIIASRPRIIPMRMFSNLIMVIAMSVFGALTFVEGWNDRKLGLTYLCIVGIVAGAYGFFAVMAIGGGDMPVSIAFLNSLSGFSTSAAGLMLNNKALVVSGAFVGCSGLILTLVMCNAMNRSVSNVLIGGFGEGSASATKAAKIAKEDQGVVQEMSAEDVVEALTSAKSVIVVPGYGMVRNFACNSLSLFLLNCFSLMLLFFIFQYRPLPKRSTQLRNSLHDFERVESRCALPSTRSPVACLDT
jgi:NAD/NADP transhydrogenase beta subunit